MGLQWVMLGCAVVAEAAVAVLLSLPWPRPIRSPVVALVSLILQPAGSVLPFAGFQLLDLYWKHEHRLMCNSEACTILERDHYEKSIFKAQRNIILCVSACFLYWCIYAICKFQKKIIELEEAEKRGKNEW